MSNIIWIKIKYNDWLKIYMKSKNNYKNKQKY